MSAPEDVIQALQDAHYSNDPNFEHLLSQVMDRLEDRDEGLANERKLGEALYDALGRAKTAETALRSHHRVEQRMNGDGTCAVCGPAVWASQDD